MKTSLTILLILSFYFSSLYAFNVNEKINKANKCLDKGEITKAISIYGMISNNKGLDKKIRSNALYTAASMLEKSLNEYGKALRLYKQLLTKYPEYSDSVKIQNKINFLNNEIAIYSKSIDIIKKLKYRRNIGKKEVKKDIEQLEALARDNPGFHRLAEVYALLCNRHAMISKWYKAYRYYIKTDKVNPNFKNNSIYGRDMEIAVNTFWRKLFTRLSIVFLLLYFIILVKLRPWEVINSGKLKTCLLIILVWIILAVSVYSIPLMNTIPKAFPLLRGIETPSSLFIPVHVLLWYKPFMEARFLFFILYSTVAILFLWLGSIALPVRRNKVFNPLVIVCSVIMSFSMLTLFYYNHCTEGFRYKYFLFYEEDSQEAKIKYPEIFKEVTTLEKNEK